MAYPGKKSSAGALAFEELKKRIRENRLQGVYLFWGAEEYTKDFYAEKLRHLAKGSPLPVFNYVLFDAETQTPSELEDAMFAPPYLWESKVIEIRGLLPSKLSAEQGTLYAQLLSHIPPYLTVLLVLRAGEYGGSKPTAGDAADGKEKEPKRGGFSKVLEAVEAGGLCVEFLPEKGEKLCQWVAKHFAARSVRIAPGVPAFLISYCGSDMYTLQGEIRKLCDAVGTAVVTEQEVRAYCSPNESYVFFDVANCLNRHDAAGAKRILSGLRMTPDAVTMAIGYLASTYQQMIVVRAGMDAGKSAAQIAAETKIPAWKVQKLLPALAQTDPRELHAAVREISDADARLKTLRGNPEGILELLLYRICAYEER